MHKKHTISYPDLLYFQLQPTDSNYLNALWGKLASEILMQNWDPALEDLNRLKEIIEANVCTDCKNVDCYIVLVHLHFLQRKITLMIYCLLLSKVGSAVSGKKSLNSV